MTKSKINRVIIAAAGSGKTTHLVDIAVKNPNKRILITTYTDANSNEIKAKFYHKLGYIPHNIQIMPWFSFLLTHCVRPYQGKLCKERVDNLVLVSGVSTQWVSETDVERYYFDAHGRIFSDKLAKFAYKYNQVNNDLVTYRLSLLYDAIFIDEIQDIAGWDLGF